LGGIRIQHQTHADAITDQRPHPTDQRQPPRHHAARKPPRPARL